MIIHIEFNYRTTIDNPCLFASHWRLAHFVSIIGHKQVERANMAYSAQQGHLDTDRHGR